MRVPSGSRDHAVVNEGALIPLCDLESVYAKM